MNAHVESPFLESALHPSYSVRPFPLIAPIRRSALAVLLTAVLAATDATAAAPVDDYTFVQRNGPAEWAAAGDFNGDGLLDSVIVDRVTGSYRIGYQQPGGNHTWTSARASGIEKVTGFTVGNLFNAATHGFAFTAEAANRVNVVSAENSSQAGVPVTVFGPSVGPNQVVAIDIGGAGNTPLHDLVVATTLNGASPFRTTTVRNPDGAALTTLQDSPGTQRWDRGNRVVFRDGTAPVVAVLHRGATDTLRLIRYPAGIADAFLQFPNLASGSDYTVGRFAGNGLAHFLVYRPGQNSCAAHPVLEPIAGTFAAGAATSYNLEGAIASLVTLPADTGVAAKFLAVLDGGTRAIAYSFDGASAPVAVQEFFPPDGQVLLGATPLGGGGIYVAAGDLDGRTRTTARYTFDAGTGTFAHAGTDVLPGVSDFSGRANVFQFRNEPFVHSAPGLLHSGNAGDWTSLFALAGLPPQVGVTSETFVDATHGLDNPTATSLGTSHPLAQFGLGNQYSEAVSIFRLTSGAGNEVLELSAQPPGALYVRSVGVRIVGGAPGYSIHYRLNPTGAWQLYAGQSLLIFTNTTLQYRAQAIFGNTQTAIRSDVYAFQEGPSTLDSDDDGVPDFVEAGRGLDPRAGNDTDGDGASDLEEFLKGTLPNNPDSFPATSGYEQHAAVDWTLTPRPIDGTTGAEAAARGGPHVRVFGLSGSQMGTGPLRGSGSALITNVFIDPQQPLLLAATEPHFDIITASPDIRLGRELVALLPSPEVAPIQVDYEFGAAGGVLINEANNWVNAAQLAYNSATRETRSQTMTVARTTAAILLEEKLRRILAEATPDITNLTLFPFRPNDASRQIFDADAQAFLRHGSPTRPAYDLRQMHQSLENLVIRTPNPNVQALNAVAVEIYRLSSASNNAAPGHYHPPFDVLREFIRAGEIHANYLAVGSFPAGQLANATAGVAHVIDSIGSRPVTNLTLRIRPDTLSGPCTTVETADLAARPVHLFALNGGPYDFPEAFELLPGTIIHVTGRPDVVSTTCDGLNVEVLDISLQAVAVRSGSDENGNLLNDVWENIFLGGGTLDPFGDEDDDGYTNLQEMFDGTDPRDRQGVPPVPAAPLQLPLLDIGAAPDGTPVLEWSWPEPYLSKVQFQVLSSDSVTFGTAAEPLSPVHVGNGILRATIPNVGGTARFFKVSLLLRF